MCLISKTYNRGQVNMLVLGAILLPVLLAVIAATSGWFRQTSSIKQKNEVSILIEQRLTYLRSVVKNPTAETFLRTNAVSGTAPYVFNPTINREVNTDVGSVFSSIFKIPKSETVVFNGKSYMISYDVSLISITSLEPYGEKQCSYSTPDCKLGDVSFVRIRAQIQTTATSGGTVMGGASEVIISI